MAFLADSVSEQCRAKANAFVGFQIGLVFMLSLIIGPVITSSVGLSGLFWVIGLLSIVAILAIFFIAFNSIKTILPSLLSRTASTSKRGLAMGIFSTSQFLGIFF